MVQYPKKDFKSSKIDSIQLKNSNNELSIDTKFALSKFNFSVSESGNKIESSSTVKFNNAFWVEFSELVAELDALATEIKALDD